ncbi:MAG TPA: 23S rRNA (adenine(2503)-C(2))-methyltransferase RlmN [Anaerolineae bacterium]|nr:23S rRNA (adenine(2503)-C(2))-methyltransferase RlmN [Anaerolineae bacterium]
MMSKINLYDLTYTQLVDQLAAWGYSVYHSDKLWHALYHQNVSDWGEADLRADLVAKLQTETVVSQPEIAYETVSQDGTRKYLLRLADGHMIETVLMAFKGRYTACISTQVGCALGCVFCATGQMGFTRHLTPGEIVLQLRHNNEVLAAHGEKIRNIVLMGMGEPLHNYDNTMAAIEILCDHKGLSLAPRHITLSTVGMVPGIRRLADEKRRVRLAVSLHGATDAERTPLVPVGQRWPLAELMAACRYYSQKMRRKIFFEWTLIAGKNDTAEQAHALGQLLADMSAHVNLIPLNPTSNYGGVPSQEGATERFRQILASYDVPNTIRQRRGIDVDAGCGQLRERVINESITIQSPT